MRRKPSAQFFQNLIEAKVNQSNLQNAICIAIDGNWGTGKSFFIENWAKDLAANNRCVVQFDAWKNDLSDDPLLGFISGITNSLRPWIARTEGEKAARKVAKRTKELMSNAAKAIVPLTVATTQQIAAKYVSTEMGNILRGITNNEGETKRPSQDYNISEKEIEKYFEATLANQKKQQESVSSLINNLEKLATELSEKGIPNPIYIFIDELDRCRPTYAIRLLEGIKHLLNAKGICFIVATNLGQLSHSVKSVYGADFDGSGYLKRFFDYEYKLPPPDRYNFCKHELSQSIIANDDRLFTGLEKNVTSLQTSPSDILAQIAITFEIDLRSIKQIIGHIEAAILCIPRGHKIHCIYLFSLAAIAHKSPKTIDLLCSGPYDRIPEIDKISTSHDIKYTEKVAFGSSSMTGREHTLLGLIARYQNAAHKNPIEYSRISDSRNSIVLNNIDDAISEDIINNNRHAISMYPSYVRMANSVSSN
ncbi:MAG: KAP family P-loop NTPase fold protein [Pseudomonadales bacterium]